MKHSLIALLLFTAACSKQQKIPEISLQLPDSTRYFNTTALKKGKVTLMMYYQPYCEACRAEWQDIAAHMDNFKDVQFCLITDHPYIEMMAFYKNYNLKQYDNVIAGRDTGYTFQRLYKPSGTPHNVFFDVDKRYRGGGTAVFTFKQLDSIVKKL